VEAPRRFLTTVDSAPDTVIRSTFAHIDLGALADNFRTLTAYLAERRRGHVPPEVVAVVKANAYGHGAAPVALALERAGATMVACADIEEAITLRTAGLEARVLVFGALSLSDLDGVFDFRLTPTVSTPTAGRSLQAAAERRGVRVRYHLKIDTGMNRLGFRHDNLGRTMPELLASPNLELEGVYTHFATADAPAHPLFAEQKARFTRVLAELAAMGARPAHLHAANSAAMLSDAGTWFDMVRPGLVLYGVTPAALPQRIGLKPVMSLRSRIVAVKGVRPGEFVGYGARFEAARPTRMAVIPAGYADGLDVRLAGRASVLVRGRRAPIIGSVCMDMLMADVTGSDVQPGDEAVLVGRQGDDDISVAEMAEAIGTIPYEVLCRVGTRIERIYI
jgi:alanine racemase